MYLNSLTSQKTLYITLISMIHMDNKSTKTQMLDICSRDIKVLKKPEQTKLSGAPQLVDKKHSITPWKKFNIFI